MKKYLICLFRNLIILSIHLTFFSLSAQEKKDYLISTIAFYNVENLFDTEDNPETFDDDRTASGKDAWTEEKYQKKIENISRVLSEIGTDVNPEPPAILGVCEIENRKVLEDLIIHPNLRKYNYGIIHFDSQDERGVDVALLYRKQHFTPLDSKTRRLVIYEADNPTKRDYTRDQLVVSGLLNKEEVNFIVNHWPSRGGGEKRSAYKREKAASLNKRIIDSLVKINPDARIISMGDFNDDPTNKSFKKILKTEAGRNRLSENSLYNPMENMLKEGKGSLAYRDSWNLFDQIFMTSNLLNKKSQGFEFYKAGIFNKPYLITQNGQFKDYPFRTYGYSGYEGGYSDHFPVYIYLIRQINSN
ncbi:endonuclease/exonuclease/phosphatase family protein [Christiangramia crocea]|uniref:Endonuclease/exonuclease/phosphatase family protein n=1 Tax=Christiangramia crocea TaxID=2904124 RepID=A0A9X1UVQ1_9FLAO|nr:endonuclease/exonuclease/phosphatase family protein [Gramella crocea]MCG9971287.1 endonuclease/exonuclease/phosphatase family protein [Gramella crocea]